MSPAETVALVCSHGAHGAQRSRLPDGRWHFHHGPIDLIIGADGEIAAIEAAVEAAWRRFQRLLSELVSELRLLRLPVQFALGVRGAVARRMVTACEPHLPVFVTPMAAVAGAVADEMIEFFHADPDIRRAYINNGGDIAVHLAPGMDYRVGMIAAAGRAPDLLGSALDGELDLGGERPERGIATSGWRGRSLSLGIADSVTVVAANAAAADAAATLIANAVNVDDPAILRKPAWELKDDTDLGERLVTVAVGRLVPGQVDAALVFGEQAARAMRARGLIGAAVLRLQGLARVIT